MTVALHGIRKSYHLRPPNSDGAIRALDGVDLRVEEGELMVVVGPSGSGKTTLLRCIAGLEDPDEGRVEVKGRDVTDVSPGDRDVAMVFQEYALYPHLSVEANITFGLRARKIPAEETRRRTTEVARMLGLEDVLSRRPADLSGGERQRVALARAVAREPAAYLMDEPLSNLDAELRARTRTEIRALQQRLATTTVYVTHDQVEAMTMGDRVTVLRQGRVEQVGTPRDLYDRPQTTFVARFFGTPPMNLLPASLFDASMTAVTIGVRPERIAFTSMDQGRLSGFVRTVETIGSEAIVHVDVVGHVVLVKAPVDSAPVAGAEVGLTFSEGDLYHFDRVDEGDVA